MQDIYSKQFSKKSSWYLLYFLCWYKEPKLFTSKLHMCQCLFTSSENNSFLLTSKIQMACLLRKVQKIDILRVVFHFIKKYQPWRGRNDPEEDLGNYFLKGIGFVLPICTFRLVSLFAQSLLAILYLVRSISRLFYSVIIVYFMFYFNVIKISSD